MKNHKGQIHRTCPLTGWWGSGEEDAGLVNKGRTWGETRSTDGETGWGRGDQVLESRGGTGTRRKQKSRKGEDLRQGFRLRIANHLDQVHDVGKEDQQ